MSTSTDITKWMLMQLNDGKNQKGDTVISSRDLKQTHSPQTAIRSASVEAMFHKPLAPFLVTDSSYAMGWKTGIYKGQPALIKVTNFQIVIFYLPNSLRVVCDIRTFAIEKLHLHSIVLIKGEINRLCNEGFRKSSAAGVLNAVCISTMKSKHLCMDDLYV